MCEHHTSHVTFFSVLHNYLNAHAWLKSCVCRAHIMCHELSPCAHVFVLTLFDYSTFLSLLTIFCLNHSVLPPAHQLHLPRCGGQIPCALSLMRTLALLPSTILSYHRQNRIAVRKRACLIARPRKHTHGSSCVEPNDSPLR